MRAVFVRTADTCEAPCPRMEEVYGYLCSLYLRRALARILNYRNSVNRRRLGAAIEEESHVYAQGRSSSSHTVCRT